MPRKPRPTLKSLKAEVWAELLRGRDIYEAEIVTTETVTIGGRKRPAKFYGLCVDKRHVYVNPLPSILDSLAHELIHRLHPRMSEAVVDRTANKIAKRLTTAEARKWARQFRRVAVRKRAPLDADE